MEMVMAVVALLVLDGLRVLWGVKRGPYCVCKHAIALHDIDRRCLHSCGCDLAVTAREL